MPYLDCPSCRLTVYTAASWDPISTCPRCGTQLGDPARLFRHVKRFQRSVRGARPRDTRGPSAQR
jgi:hypothetical protein